MSQVILEEAPFHKCIYASYTYRTYIPLEMHYFIYHALAMYFFLSLLTYSIHSSLKKMKQRTIHLNHACGWYEILFL